MTNLPESLFGDATRGGVSSSSRGIDWPSATVEQLIVLLREPQYREDALSFLNKKRETDRELALPLWNSFNTVYVLLEEVLSVYKLLSPPRLTSRDSTRVCNALALFQCMASHPDTRMAFLKARVPVYLYPFLGTTEKGRPFQYLRLTSLGAIGALVKADGPFVPQAVHFFLETELFPLCLRCIEVGDVLTQSVATLIISKMLMQEEGLHYCCGVAERFYAVVHVFAGMVDKIGDEPSPRLLKNIIHCYLRMSEMPRACDALRRCIPSKLRDSSFINVLRDHPTTMKELQQLFYKITAGHWSNPEPVGEVLRSLTIR